MLFAKKKEMTELAFGKVPAYCRYELHMERYRSASDFIREAHRGRERLSVLDVGAGVGHIKLFSDFGNIDWHGVELSKRAMDECTALGYRMHELDVDEQPLPYGDGRFDVVVISHVLEHLARPGFALGEMSRVLKTGGLLIVGVPVKPLYTQYLLRLYYRLKTLPKGVTRLAVDVRGLRRLLRRCLGGRFRIVDLRGFRFISARKRANWENYRAFYRLNVWFGRLCPSLTREVNVVLRKGAAGPGA